MFGRRIGGSIREVVQPFPNVYRTYRQHVLLCEDMSLLVLCFIFEPHELYQLGVVQLVVRRKNPVLDIICILSMPHSMAPGLRMHVIARLISVVVLKVTQIHVIIIVGVGVDVGVVVEVNILLGFHCESRVSVVEVLVSACEWVVCYAG